MWTGRFHVFSLNIIVIQALLLSHPRNMTRDTQYYAWKHKLVKGNRVALRNLVQQELGLAIQTGEHSSVRFCVSTPWPMLWDDRMADSGD